MKRVVFFIIVMSAQHGYAQQAAKKQLDQKTEGYYNYNDQPCTADSATYYSTVERTDSGWLRNDYYLPTKRLAMRALYENKECTIEKGTSIDYHTNGLPSAINLYKHGKREGICTRYYSNGITADSALYHEDRVADDQLKWHRNGVMSDSIHRLSYSTYANAGWFDDGNVAYTGYMVNNKPYQKWNYYHHNGTVSAIEMYSDGKMIEASYFDTSGTQLTDTSGVNRDAEFNGGEAAWRTYLLNKIYWPRDLKLASYREVAVGIRFCIDEKGKVVDAEVAVPAHPTLDKIALDIVKSSPAWQPAISHNRKIKTYRQQPVIFVQPE